MRPIDKERIKRYLKDGPAEVEQYWQSLLADAVQRFSDCTSSGEAFRRRREEILRANALSGQRAECVGQEKAGDPDRLYHILLRTEENMRDYRAALYREAEYALEELDAVRRFMIVYRKVPPDWQGYLRALYHDGEPWKSVERESGLPHCYFTEQRNSVMEDICRMYNSGSTGAELAGQPPICPRSCRQRTKTT